MHQDSSSAPVFLGGLTRPSLNWLLALVPAGMVMDAMEVNAIYVFLVSALSIIPLGKRIGEATEVLSDYLGPTLGGLLNATLGNAPEIIIGYFALKQGLVDMVKASITGSILGNLLFGLGLAILASGRRHRNQFLRYDNDALQVHIGLLRLAMFGMIIPAVFDFSTDSEKEISVEISSVLLGIYVMSIVATFFPDQPSSDSDDDLEIMRMDEVTEEPEASWSRQKALVILASATIALAFMSEMMTDSITPFASKLGFTPVFMGVFLMALLGNAAEMMNAVGFVLKRDQLDLALAVMLGASSQMALMVAPTLVFLGMYLGKSMNLLFSNYELLAIIMTVTTVSDIIAKGRMKPKVGIIFIALYMMLGIGFYNSPL